MVHYVKCKSDDIHVYKTQLHYIIPYNILIPDRKTRQSILFFED
jgi:hypothetical protein